MQSSAELLKLRNFLVIKDEKRCGLHIYGQGFGFFAYYTGNDTAKFLECDCVSNTRNQDFTCWFQMRLPPNGAISADILETTLQTLIDKYWPIA